MGVQVFRCSGKALPTPEHLKPDISCSVMADLPATLEALDDRVIASASVYVVRRTERAPFDQQAIAVVHQPGTGIIHRQGNFIQQFLQRISCHDGGCGSRVPAQRAVGRFTGWANRGHVSRDGRGKWAGEAS
jgi:hypothetical protein